MAGGGGDAMNSTPIEGDEWASLPEHPLPVPAPDEPDDWIARALSDRWFHRDPLAWLAACVTAKEAGMTLLELVRWRLDVLKEEKEARR